MKISPLSANGIGAVAAQGSQPAAPQTRTFKMNTNATPGAEFTDQEPSTPHPGEAPADEATQPLSPQLAAVRKAQRALQVKERALADREKAIADRESQGGGGIDPARLKAQPLRTLLEAGVTYEQLTEAVLASQGNAEVEGLQAQLKALEEGFDKKLTDRDQQARQNVIAEMKREATALAAQGDDFELVRETRSIPSVITLIEKTYDETGEVLDVREAMRLVEDELVKDSLRLAGLKKVQSRFQPQPAPVPPPQQQRQTRTLTNRDNAQPPMSAKQRALAAFNGTLRR
jgi:hypothetical protein